MHRAFFSFLFNSNHDMKVVAHFRSCLFPHLHYWSCVFQSCIFRSCIFSRPLSDASDCNTISTSGFPWPTVEYNVLEWKWQIFGLHTL